MCISTCPSANAITSAVTTQPTASSPSRRRWAPVAAHPPRSAGRVSASRLCPKGHRTGRSASICSKSPPRLSERIVGDLLVGGCAGSSRLAAGRGGRGRDVGLAGQQGCVTVSEGSGSRGLPPIHRAAEAAGRAPSSSRRSSVPASTWPLRTSPGLSEAQCTLGRHRPVPSMPLKEPRPSHLTTVTNSPPSRSSRKSPTRITPDSISPPRCTPGRPVKVTTASMVIRNACRPASAHRPIIAPGRSRNDRFRVPVPLRGALSPDGRIVARVCR